MSTHSLHHRRSTTGLAEPSSRRDGRSYPASQRDLVIASLLARPDKAVADLPPLSWSR